MAETTELKIYEDDVCTAVLADAALGHVQVIPKKKAREMHELEPKEISHIFRVACYASTVIFETLKLHGTNILVNTLNPQLTVDIIPRKQDDDLDFQWERKPMPEEEFVQVLKQVKDKTDYIGAEKPSAEIKEAEKEEIKEEEGVVNYLLKQIERIP
jgi:diadenosine tetraphosphate (Ap4A) HIT family hydrolase